MKNILIVENEEALREILTEELNQEDYQIFQASNGVECLDIVKKEHIDLILLDLAMPVMTGLEAIKELKTMEESPSVIVLSNKEDLETLSEILSFHVFRYLIKADHSLQEISEIVKQALK